MIVLTAFGTVQTAVEAMKAGDITGFANASAVSSSNQNGMAAGTLSSLLRYQRSYQASAKIITATDQIMQDTVNMKQ